MGSKEGFRDKEKENIDHFRLSNLGTWKNGNNIAMLGTQEKKQI